MKSSLNANLAASPLVGSACLDARPASRVRAYARNSYNY